MRIVFDTCVLVAALRSRKGASFKLLQTVRHRLVTPLLSVPLFLEYEAVLKRPDQRAASGLSEAEIDIILDVIAACGEARKLHFLWRPVLSDPGDEMVLEVAIHGTADAIVTHNTKDFLAATARFGVSVLTPQAALIELRRTM